MSGRLLVAASLVAVLAAVSVAAAAPPGYEPARQRIVVEGRSVATLVRSGDAKAVHARFTPQLAKAAPLAEVKRVLADARRTAPIGRRLAETALPMSPGGRLYTSSYRWGKRRIELQVAFDARGRIAGINLAPPGTLPRDPHAGRRLRARLTLPFSGEWWVFWGGPTERQNYHVISPDQRHAYDLLVWRSGATYRGTGRRNADYWAWDEPVLAPGAGRVVEAVDGIRDNRPQVEVENRNAPAGNHVVLDLGNGEYALLAHFRKGSLAVRAGDRVQAGDVLGRVGNSGNSSEPHIHFHLQDRPGLFGAARGLPITFVDYRADGRRVARGTPVQGQFVVRAP